MSAIKKEISTQAITGFPRVGQHEFFGITANLEMIQQVRVRVLSNDGTPMLDVIGQDENLTPIQRQDAVAVFQDKVVTKTTEGAFVNMAGQVVAEDTPGAFPQRMFIQGITIGNLKAMGVTINDETSVASLLFILIGSEISNIDGRGDL